MDMDERHALVDDAGAPRPWTLDPFLGGKIQNSELELSPDGAEQKEEIQKNKPRAQTGLRDGPNVLRTMLRVDK